MTEAIQKKRKEINIREPLPPLTRAKPRELPSERGAGRRNKKTWIATDDYILAKTDGEGTGMDCHG
jgi:hypothetical protein